MSTKTDSLNTSRKRTTKKIQSKPKLIESSKTENQTTVVANTAPINVTMVPQIKYSKWNPRLSEQKINTIWNVIKYGLLILALVFGILALYFSSVWQVSAGSDGAMTVGTLQKLGILSSDGKAMFSGWDGGTLLQMYGAQTDAINASLSSLKWAQLSLAQLTFYTNGLNTMLMIFGILSIAVAFPLMVFKNITEWGLGMLVVETLLVLVVLVLFFIGMSAQNSLISNFWGINHSISQYQSLANSGDAVANAKEISKVLANITQYLSNIEKAIATFSI